MKVSVIDLGFNSAKLVSYEVRKDGLFQPYQQESIRVRLGEDMQVTGYLGKDPIRRSVKALRIFRDMIKFDSVRHVLPIATSAVRDAGNREEFLDQIRSETGFIFKVLSGNEEALYSYI